MSEEPKMKTQPATPKSISDSYLAGLHYAIKTEKDPEAYIRKQLEGTDYELQKFNRGVAHYKRKSDGSHHISIKGTDPSKFKDLLSDARLAVGLGGIDKQFKRRANQVKDIYRNNPEGDKYLLGHSLGGSIGTHMMAKSKGIRDTTKKANFFNTGYTPAFHSELTGRLSKDDKKVLKDKIVQHHIIGDPVSSSLLTKSIGKVKKYSIKAKDLLKKHTIHSF